MSYVEFKNVSKTYKTGEVSVEALKDASFEIGKGEICVIVGQSGAGNKAKLALCPYPLDKEVLLRIASWGK